MDITYCSSRDCLRRANCRRGQIPQGIELYYQSDFYTSPISCPDFLPLPDEPPIPQWPEALEQAIALLRQAGEAWFNASELSAMEHVISHALACASLPVGSSRDKA